MEIYLFSCISALMKPNSRALAMDVISKNADSSSPSSTLNPSAPMFVPSAYRAVEDFSGEWWDLVHSSPWFRDYWLQERFHDPQTDSSSFPEYDEFLFPELDSFFDPNLIKQEEEEERDYRKDLVSLGALKWRKGRGFPEKARYAEKAPKIVNVKVSPRPIQQPR